MARSIETIVGAHQIAAERRAEGKGIWDRKLRIADIWNDDDMAIEVQVKAIAARIRSQVQPHFPDDEELEQIVDEMEWIVEQFGSNASRHRDQIETEFNYVWDGFYDWCDLVSRVWVERF